MYDFLKIYTDRRTIDKELVLFRWTYLTQLRDTEKMGRL